MCSCDGSGGASLALRSAQGHLALLPISKAFGMEILVLFFLGKSESVVSGEKKIPEKNGRKSSWFRGKLDKAAF